MNKKFRKILIDAIILQFNSVIYWKREEVYNQILNGYDYFFKKEYEILFNCLNNKLVKFQPILILDETPWDGIKYFIDLKIHHNAKEQKLYGYKYYMKHNFKIKQRGAFHGTLLPNISNKLIELNGKLTAIEGVFSSLNNEKLYRKDYSENDNIIHDPEDEPEPEFEDEVQKQQKLYNCTIIPNLNFKP